MPKINLITKLSNLSENEITKIKTTAIVDSNKISFIEDGIIVKITFKEDEVQLDITST